MNRQIKDGKSSLGRLVVEDMQLTTDEAIREGWALYFQKYELRRRLITTPSISVKWTWTLN